MKEKQTRCARTEDEDMLKRLLKPEASAHARQGRVAAGYSQGPGFQAYSFKGQRTSFRGRPLTSPRVDSRCFRWSMRRGPGGWQARARGREAGTDGKTPVP
ncbi:hypothetical protein ASNO1_21120 [Corallococcus caeni]|uniref:Uncharacterized protein n=1 Tax=Corallococcus caeni TaxID=3082388 RepID=A0ABQ6QPB8_9BACT|nr:hypothetical protein ASNO1_21120 [Corallococcus sp. NO1]